MSSPYIGVRYMEILERCEKLVEEASRDLSVSERGFLDDMIVRLETYKEKSYVTAKQLNWLTNIEADNSYPWNG